MTVNDQAVGSGAGITSLESKTVDFGASDPPLKPADEEAIAKNGSPAVQIPMFLGAITVSYNLAGVKTGLKLDGRTLADIYLGNVKTWNAPQIKALNPGVALPATAITTIHRSDSSGTNAGFTGFLSAAKERSALGRNAEVEEVAQAAAFLDLGGHRARHHVAGGQGLHGGQMLLQVFLQPLVPLGPASGLRIEPGLPELEGDIDPGKLLLTQLDDFDDLWLRVHDHADQFGGSDQIKKSIIHHADIVVLKALLGRRGQNERGSSERPGMEVTCSNATVIQAHFTVIEGNGCTQCL